MKKKIIIGSVLALILVCIVVGISANKTEQTAIDISNTSEEPEKVVGDDSSEDEQEIAPESFVGVYVAEDTFYLEAVYITLNEEEFTVYMRDSFGTYTDNVKASEAKDGKIESDLMDGTYTIELTDEGIVVNSDVLVIEDLKMKKAFGKLDGIYENDTHYFVLCTLSNEAIRLITINKETTEYFVEKSEESNILEDSATIKDVSGNHVFNITKTDGKIELKVDTTAPAWKAAEGTYNLVTK